MMIYKEHFVEYKTAIMQHVFKCSRFSGCLKVTNVITVRCICNLYAIIILPVMTTIYNKTRCNSGNIVLINNCRYALHVLDALCVNHQEHYKL